MRNSTILKWASNNNKNNKLSLGSSKNNDKSGGNKNWIHSPDTLLNGHVVYLVKFLGDIEVDQPKGIEVVKQGVQKLKFNQQLKKSEAGSGNAKTPKAELTISVNGVTIQEPKSKKVLHEYPLHRISYCADDKAEKRFFSFIAKDADSNKHTCFVFLSDKLAEEITLTIGQAFELAYKKYLESRGKDLETKKQSMIMQKRIEILEEENKELKKRLADVAKIKGDLDVKKYMKDNNIAELCTVESNLTSIDSVSSSAPHSLQSTGDDKIDNTDQSDSNRSNPLSSSSNQSGSELICLDESTSSQMDFGGITLDNFELDGLNDDDFDPRAEESSQSSLYKSLQNTPISAPTQVINTPSPVAPLSTVPPVVQLAPPPALPPRDQMKQISKTGAISPALENNNNPFNNPFGFPSSDPFGMAPLATNSSTPAITPSRPDPFAALDDLDPFKNIQ